VQLQPGRHHPRVVDNQDVTLAEKAREIPYPQVNRLRAESDEQARRVPRVRRDLGDRFFRQVVTGYKQSPTSLPYGTSRSGPLTPQGRRGPIAVVRVHLHARRGERACRRGKAEVLPRERCCHPATGRPHEHAELQEERLVDVLDGLGFLANRDSECAQADWPTTEAEARSLQDRPVHLVEAQFVDLEQLQAELRATSSLMVPSPRTSA
jgi:hypothetical protein